MGIDQIKYIVAIAILSLFLLLAVINRYGSYRKKKSGKDDDIHWL